MKIIRTLVLTGLLCCISLQAQAQKKWQVGARAGIIGIPYSSSAERLGTGIFIGVYMQSFSANETSIIPMLDFRKVDNLLIEKLEQSVVVLPDGAYRGTEFISVSGFAGLRLGLRLDQGVKRFRSGKLKVCIESYAELLTSVRANQQSEVSVNSFNGALVDSRGGSTLTFPGASRGVSSGRNMESEGNIVFSGGVGLIYELAAGPQISCSVQLDLNDRFSLFSGVSDARLTQVQIGFNYPLGTRLK